MDVFLPKLTLTCFPGSDWRIISTVNDNINFVRKRNKKFCLLLIQSLDLRLKTAKRQLSSQFGRNCYLTTHNFDSMVSGTKCPAWSRAQKLFLQKTPLWKQKKRTFVEIPSFFVDHSVWATGRRKGLEGSWHLHSIYLNLGAGRYLSQSLHSSKLTLFVWSSNFKTFVAQNILEVPHQFLKP